MKQCTDAALGGCFVSPDKVRTNPSFSFVLEQNKSGKLRVGYHRGSILKCLGVASVGVKCDYVTARGFVQVGLHAVFRSSQISPWWLDEEWTALAARGFIGSSCRIESHPPAIIFADVFVTLASLRSDFGVPSPPSPFQAPLSATSLFFPLLWLIVLLSSAPSMYLLFLCLVQSTHFPECRTVCSSQCNFPHVPTEEMEDHI